jgi:hypothetical protein
MWPAKNRRRYDRGALRYRTALVLQTLGLEKIWFRRWWFVDI